MATVNDTDTTNIMINTALALAGRGLAVFPCLPRDKRPATPHGCKDATADQDIIKQWWRREPNYNVAIATGAISGVFTLDIDNAEHELAKLERDHGELPPTVETITARGRHLYFKMPTGAPVRNSASKLAPGIDVRGDGGYTIAPPSVHPSGRRYCWSVDSASAFAEAPPWLLDRLCARNGGNGHTTVPPSEWREMAAGGIAEGQRDDGIARMAGMLLRRCVDPVVTLELLQAWNATRCAPPLPEKDVFRIVNSIAGMELRRRQGGAP